MASFTLQIPESDVVRNGLFLFARADGYANQAVWFWPSIWQPLGEANHRDPAA
jgi:hypothetical protein